MRWAGHVARIAEKRNTYRIVVGKPEGKRPLGRTRRAWWTTLIWILRSWDRGSLMYSSITNKMQRYTVVFITINALHVSGVSSAHHQELKTVYTASGICRDVII
jgi:hypothetical protein